MDTYRGMFVLSTINGPCTWHQAIARPFNKNLNAKLMCDFGITRFIFYAVSAGLRVKSGCIMQVAKLIKEDWSIVLQ